MCYYGCVKDWCGCVKVEKKYGVDCIFLFEVFWFENIVFLNVGVNMFKIEYVRIVYLYDGKKWC